MKKKIEIKKEAEALAKMINADFTALGKYLHTLEIKIDNIETAVDEIVQNTRK